MGTWDSEVKKAREGVRSSEAVLARPTEGFWKRMSSHMEQSHQGTGQLRFVYATPSVLGKGVNSQVIAKQGSGSLSPGYLPLGVSEHRNQCVQRSYWDLQGTWAEL